MGRSVYHAQKRRRPNDRACGPLYAMSLDLLTVGESETLRHSVPQSQYLCSRVTKSEQTKHLDPRPPFREIGANIAPPVFLQNSDKVSP